MLQAWALSSMSSINALKNMIFMWKMKGVTILNSMEALGIIPSPDNDNSVDEERVIAL
jgi:hypothetical protein